MGRDRTTIWRELQRNTGQRGYRHQQAQHWAVARHRTKPKQVKLTPEVQAVLVPGWRNAGVRSRLLVGVAGRPGNGSAPRPSTSILPGINGLAAPLYRQLRYQGKSYRKKYGRTTEDVSGPGRY